MNGLIIYKAYKSILAAGLALFLPETMGKPMTQTIDEAESSYYKKNQKGDYVLGIGINY